MTIARPKLLLLPLALGAVLGTAPRSAMAAAPAPIATFPFDAGTGTAAADASGGGSDGTFQGDAGWGTGLVGAHDLSLSGRGQGFVDIPRPVVDTSQSFTVMAAVRLNRIDGFQTAVSIDGDTLSGFFLQLRGDTGEFAFTIPPINGEGATTIAGSDIGPEANHWYHLAGVYDAAAHTLSLYVNGTLQETVPFTSPWKATGHTAIGRGKYGGNPVDFVGGQIDDVRLYQSAVSAADIHAVAQAEIPAASMQAATPPGPATLHINAAGVAAKVSPLLYGLMTEEINYSYDGGLYAELIQNRAFKNSATEPAHWAVVQDGGGAGTISLDTTQPVNDALTTSLKLEITAAGQRVGVANDGYWGIPVKPNTTYKASFWAKAAPGFTGPLAVGIESTGGGSVVSGTVPKITGDWKQYTITLKTGKSVTTSADNHFVISAKSPGTVWLGLVSLMPPTYKNRPNGNRIDLMEKMAAMKPAFLRLPGGNYLEGNTIPERFDWKKTIGPISNRPTHRGPWGYQSSDGMGLLEFLEWCEDLHMETVLAVYAGYSLRGDHVNPGPDLQPYVQDALDEIEYVTGDKSTKWGAVRAANGHPAPFPVHYVEIGNEDWFDRARTYDARYAQFHDAIKAKYPNLQLIATAAVQGRTPDVIDEHYYKSARAFEQDAHRYDTYDRKGPKIFVGEWASQEGKPTPNMNSAIGDAAWMTGMERNSDIVPIESYAPMFVNVNPGGSQWGTNLIGYDALTSYGSPSYYAQVMFGAHVGDVVLPVTTDAGGRFFQSVTRDTKSGTIYAKLVNAAAAPQPITFDLQGVTRVAPTATITLLTSASTKDTNTLTAPTKVVPVTSKVTGVGKTFTYTLPPNSVAVLEIGTK